jgi:hypothetical protein
MAKVKFTIKNDKGEDVVKSTKEILTEHYRNYLNLMIELESEINDVEKLDKQLLFIANLCDDVTVDDLLKRTNFADIAVIFARIYACLVGEEDPKEKN